MLIGQKQTGPPGIRFFRLETPGALVITPLANPGIYMELTLFGTCLLFVWIVYDSRGTFVCTNETYLFVIPLYPKNYKQYERYNLFHLCRGIHTGSVRYSTRNCLQNLQT